MYNALKDFHVGEKGWLGYSAGKLYYFSLEKGGDTITVIDAENLTVEGTLELDGVCVCLVCTCMMSILLNVHACIY